MVWEAGSASLSCEYFHSSYQHLPHDQKALSYCYFLLYCGNRLHSFPEYVELSVLQFVVLFEGNLINYDAC